MGKAKSEHYLTKAEKCKIQENEKKKRISSTTTKQLKGLNKVQQKKQRSNQTKNKKSKFKPTNGGDTGRGTRGNTRMLTDDGTN